MASVPPLPPAAGEGPHTPILSRTRLIAIGVLLALLALSLLFIWLTRDAMQHIHSGRRATRGANIGRALVDLTPLQTAQALLPLAVSAEETAYAQEAERLADHASDQAFAAALREATISAQHRTLSGEALTLSQKVSQLEQSVAQDKTDVQQITAKQGAATAPATAKSASSESKSSSSAADTSGGSDLDIAKAKLQLDSDELADAREDLDRASGDERTEIQNELNAHEAAMKKYDAEQRAGGQLAVIDASRYATLSGRLSAWNAQRTRRALIQQAQDQAAAAATTLMDAHNKLEQEADKNAQGTAPADEDRAAHLARIREASLRRQLLSIYDDRVRTVQELAAVYQKWGAQVELQHRILLHLILQSVVWVLFIAACIVIIDGLVRKAMDYPHLEPRQRHTLRAILSLAVNIIGLLFILMVIFGVPRGTPQILGFTTAAVTIVLQDFIISFFGWFVLMGPKGIRVGDAVEIDGIGGEVTDLDLFSTTLLETGTLAGKGFPTGRRITVMNSFAIRGRYFNFSTAGQWLWDQLEIPLPATGATHAIIEKIQKAVEEETAENAHQAEREWARGGRGASLSRFGSSPSVNLRPSATGFDLEVYYVTRASQRVSTRNRLYARVSDVLQESASPAPSTST
ncbi:MAG TPA: mechanosensitive ion channel domain-containing protein [Terracidiphilus sp.]